MPVPWTGCLHGKGSGPGMTHFVMLLRQNRAVSGHFLPRTLAVLQEIRTKLVRKCLFLREKAFQIADGTQSAKNLYARKQ